MIAITGAAGFIGSNLAARLAELGHHRDLLLVDRPLERPKADNLDGLPSSRFLEQDAFLDRVLRDDLDAVEAIFHLGACSDTTEQDWGFLLRNNVEYSQHLWRWCARRRVPLIYASSAATYGDGAAGFDDATPPHRLRPLNLYGRSKNEFDRWVLGRREEGGAAPRGWAGLKFFNVYGPREGHKGRMASMVWHAYNQIAAAGEVGLFKSEDPAYPDGGQRRDFVYVGDCVDHLIWLWRHPEVCGIFNSGTGQDRPFLDLVAATFAALDRPLRVRFIDLPRDLRGRYQYFTRAAMHKLAAAGYPGRPTPLEKGVRQTVAWLQSHAPAIGLPRAPRREEG